MQIRITKTRAAMAALFILAGVGLGSLLSPLVGTAFATAGQIVNISDRSSAANFAKVDAGGKLAVGDGSGPLTVDGTVKVGDGTCPLSVDGTVAARPAAPASPWRAFVHIESPNTVYFAGPSASPINITSLSISTAAASGSSVTVSLFSWHVPNSATSCGAAVFDAFLWQILDAGDGVTPLSFTFPTPLQVKPPANTKACVSAQATTNDTTIMNAVGFYGG